VPYRRKKSTFAISSPDEFLYYFVRVGRSAKYCNHRVCVSYVSVCLSARISQWDDQLWPTDPRNALYHMNLEWKTLIHIVSQILSCFKISSTRLLALECSSAITRSCAIAETARRAMLASSCYIHEIWELERFQTDGRTDIHTTTAHTALA